MVTVGRGRAVRNEGGAGVREAREEGDGVEKQGTGDRMGRTRWDAEWGEPSTEQACIWHVKGTGLSYARCIY